MGKVSVRVSQRVNVRCGSGGGGGGDFNIEELGYLFMALGAGAVAWFILSNIVWVLLAVCVLAVCGVAALMLYLRRPQRPPPVLWRQAQTVVPQLPGGRPPVAAPQPRAALPAPVQVHHHWHGVSAEDVARILRDR